MDSSGDIHRGGARPRPPHPPGRRLTAAVLAAAIGLTLAVAGGAEPAGAADTFEVTARVSVTSAGAEVVQDTELQRPAVDGTGRLIAFTGVGAYAAGDTNASNDVYVRDRLAGTTTRVSVTDAEGQVNGPSILCGASADLRFVGFWSSGSNLPSGGTGQIYVRDRQEGLTAIVSLGAGGLPSQKPGGGSGIASDGRCDISSDGRYVVFASEGNGFVADGNGVSDIFRRDRQTSTTIRVSVRDDENELSGFGSTDPQVSDDGDVVAFATRAKVQIADGNDATDVFTRRINAGQTLPVSTKTNGSYPVGAAQTPAISGDGQVVAFTSQATDLTAEPDDNGASTDVYVRAALGGPTTRASVSSTEAQGNALSYAPALSHDGRFVTFISGASNLWLFDSAGSSDVFLRDRELGLTSLSSRRVESLVTTGWDTTGAPAISADGTAVAYGSVAPTLVRNDTNGTRDVFVRDTDIDLDPFGSIDELVAQQYADFLGRAPTAPEATEWRQRLRHGEVSPDGVVTFLAHSPGWSQHRAPVTRLYWAFFLRAPDKGGLDYWVAQKAAGKGLHTIAGQFAQSKEFKDTYGSLSNSAFVTLVYQNVLERDPAPNEVAYWSGQLSSGAKTRGSVMVGFSESAEGRTFLAPQVDVVLVYVGMLGVVPAKLLFIVLTGGLEGGSALGELVQIVRTSDDYADRVDS